MKYISGYVKEEYNVRSFGDRRKRVDRYTVEYFDGIVVYRKSFEFAPGMLFEMVKPLIPKTIK